MYIFFGFQRCQKSSRNSEKDFGSFISLFLQFSVTKKTLKKSLPSLFFGFHFLQSLREKSTFSYCQLLFLVFFQWKIVVKRQKSILAILFYLLFKRTVIFRLGEVGEQEQQQQKNFFMLFLQSFSFQNGSVYPLFFVFQVISDMFFKTKNFFLVVFSKSVAFFPFCKYFPFPHFSPSEEENCPPENMKASL